jgi:hypothetical protein
MNKLRKKSILLIFFILSLLVNQKSLTDGPRNNQAFEKIKHSKKKHKTPKKRKSFLNKRKAKRPSRKKKYQYNSKRKFRGTTRVLSFAHIPQISQQLLNKQEAIESSRGASNEERLQESMHYLEEINKEIANSENGITIGEYTIPTAITPEIFKRIIAPQIALLVELAVIRSLIKLDDKIQPYVFTPDSKLNTLITKNSIEFNNSIQERATYRELASIDSAELNKLILGLIAIYNTEIQKENNTAEKVGYVQKIKNYFKPGETKYITQQVDVGLEKARKAFDIFYAAADQSLDPKTLKSSMISDIMYGIGIKKANIFETLQTPFISDMTTAISIKSSPKKDEMDPEAERKRANFKEYSQAYTKLVGTSFYPIKKIQGFYSRAKQFITAAENRGLLKTAAAAVAATVIGGVLVKDIYSAKKLMSDTNGTWKDAVKMGVRHTAGRPVDLAKSAWEGSKNTGRKIKEAWNKAPSIKEIAEKPGQKYREWQWKRAEKASEEAEFENRPRSHEEYYAEESNYGKKPSLIGRARNKIGDFASKFTKKGKEEKFQKDLEEDRIQMGNEDLERKLNIRDREEEIREKKFDKFIDSIPSNDLFDPNKN